ncbi:MAG: hypothetical protein JO188_17510 [Hyphomicrobiales bacterium]|nr:hypothetical protein [Acidobacteriaceae bacterium]MBV9754322.1 hypothetical protein [Hyphomicrobiales bacterium]
MMGTRLYGYGLAVILAAIAAVHAPGLTHHLHWKAAVIWGVVAVIVAALATAFLPAKA